VREEEKKYSMEKLRKFFKGPSSMEGLKRYQSYRFKKARRLTLFFQGGISRKGRGEKPTEISGRRDGLLQRKGTPGSKRNSPKNSKGGGGFGLRE